MNLKASCIKTYFSRGTAKSGVLRLRHLWISHTQFNNNSKLTARGSVQLQVH